MFYNIILNVVHTGIENGNAEWRTLDNFGKKKLTFNNNLKKKNY